MATKPVRPLRTLLEALPQELYDSIYDRVFTAEPITVSLRRKTYKFPHLLHVDRASRVKFTKSYYTVTEFEQSEPMGPEFWELIPQAYHTRIGYVPIVIDYGPLNIAVAYYITR